MTIDEPLSAGLIKMLGLSISCLRVLCSNGDMLGVVDGREFLRISRFDAHSVRKFITGSDTCLSVGQKLEGNFKRSNLSSMDFKGWPLMSSGWGRLSGGLITDPLVMGLQKNA